ncbi:unnamed protein product [Aphanomyces euteiches]|uniref:Uncharacterized protein n=1 Tax=Aphanomyces euteiches TaxID=100861 RepID=A0A6G0XH46_9STRA|nr:hypothetical protein Ae201684_005015 [Aphanomyces euteiches]
MGDVVRVYGGKVDPLERGPPKRVTHMVDNIGEHISASKKRASWKFTLGESDTVHEVVLLHSIMSTKKVVELDGREQYHASTMTPGDWTLVLMLEGTNTAIEVRINEYETAEIPKYDLLIDRVPYRKMDVYRRNNKKLVNAAGHRNENEHIQTGGYHESHWGRDGTPVAPLPREKSKAAKDLAPEINLIDTSMPEVVVPVTPFAFDPRGAAGAPPASSPVKQSTQQQQRAQPLDPFATLQPSPTPMNSYYQAPPAYGFGQMAPPPPQPQYQGMVTPRQYTTPPTPTPIYPPYNPNANLNISNMMNPMQVQMAKKAPAAPEININPFAGMR